MLQRIGTEILTPRGRIVDICNIDMFDNNNIMCIVSWSKVWSKVWTLPVENSLPVVRRH